MHVHVHMHRFVAILRFDMYRTVCGHTHARALVPAGSGMAVALAVAALSILRPPGARQRT